MKLKSKFSKGKATYKCSSCGKTTRDTGRGEGGTDICYTCYHAEEIANEHLDHGHPTFVEDCPICQEERKEPAEFPHGEFPNYYEVKHNMTEEFIEAHRTDETPGAYEPDDEMFCSEHQREKRLVDYEDGSRYECPECERERGEELGLI